MPPVFSYHSLYYCGLIPLNSSLFFFRISLNTMTLQIQSDHVYTQLGVPVSVTGVAQVTLFACFDLGAL